MTSFSKRSLCIIILLTGSFIAGLAQPSSKTGTIAYRTNTFDYYRVNLETDSLAFFWKDDEGNMLRSLGDLKTFVESKDHHLEFATNGGMYLKDGTPQGLFIQNGQQQVPVDTGDGYGNFYLKPNGVFMVGSNGAIVVTTKAYLQMTGQTINATQSGPLLLMDGELHPAFNEGSPNKYIRSGIGIIDAQHIVFAISNEPVNFYDFAMLFKEKLNCQNALYLDGAISKMYIENLQRDDLDGQFGCMIGVITAR